MAELDFNQEPEEHQDNLPALPPAQATSRFGRFLRPILIFSGIAIVLGGGYYFFSSPSSTISKGAKKIESLQKPDGKNKDEEKKKKGKPKYVKLYDLSADETSKALKELTMSGIDFSTVQTGKNFTVLVDEKDLDAAKNALALKGVPGGGNKGYELLDNSQTLGVTEFDKRIRFIRALSGELEKAILEFEVIENCKVQIVLPEQRLFAVTQPPVTASILIKKRNGSTITDDTVFSIIQLVANAVENLQPENVSVIDTEGKVLSNGIFERMAAREAGTFRDKTPSKSVQSQEELGTPILPNAEELDAWQKVKDKFERNLEEKATSQLTGILPAGSFKVAISAELGPLENGQIVDIKRLTTGIVIDNSRQDIYLDVFLKKQIFTTVASAIGYVKGRDTIQLSKADFNMMDPAEREKLAQKQRMKQYMNVALRLLPYAIAGAVVLGASVFGIRWARKRMQLKKESTPEPENPERDSDFSGLQEELNIEKQVENIKTIAQNEPDIIIQIIKKWMGK